MNHELNEQLDSFTNGLPKAKREEIFRAVFEKKVGRVQE